MSFPIEIGFTTGATLYAIIRHPNGQFWNNNTLAFENYNSAHWTNYAIALTETGATGLYAGTYPATISNVLTIEYIFNQQGGSPAVTDVPNIASARSQGVNLNQISGDSPSVANLLQALNANVPGHAVTGTLNTTSATTDLSSAVTGAYVGRIILWTSGTLTGQAAVITAYSGVTKLLSFTAVTAAPANTDSFIII